MDEGDEDVLLHLLDGLVLDQVRADAPVLLGRVEHLIVDPPTVGGLQQRMVEEETEPATGLEHPGHFCDCVVDVADVLEHQTRDNGIEGARCEGQCCSSRSGDVHTTAPLGCDAHLIPCRVDADDKVGADRRDEAADLAIAAAHVEHPRRPCQFGCSQRQDLFGVLGVGAVGEPFDPPVGVCLPQLVALHAARVRGAT